MIETLAMRAADAVMANGIMGAVSIILSIVIWLILKELKAERTKRETENNEWEKRFSDLQEKRFEEAKASVLALEQNTRALVANHAAGESRAQSITETANALRSLIATMDSNKEFFGGAVNRIEAELRRISGSRP